MAGIKQIRRFVGAELIPGIATRQWGDVPSEVSRTLRKCGYTKPLPIPDRYDKELRRPPYVDLLVHEQYFYDYYHNY